MGKRWQIIILVVGLLCFVSACATQPENIVETVIVQITATSKPTVEPTPTKEPTDIPTEVPTEPQEQILGTAPACIPPNAEINLGVVTEVVDGDTIKVIIDGETYTVRYIGIDTPETKDPN